MEIDADGIMWLDDAPAGREFTKAEIDAIRRERKQEIIKEKLEKSARRQAMIDAGHVFPVRPIPLAVLKSTRAKLATLHRRECMKVLRERLRTERLERLARTKRRKAALAKKPRVVVTTAERAAKQRERDALREEKRTAKRNAAFLKRLGVPPLPY